MIKGFAAGEPGKVRLVEFPEPTMGPGDIIITPTACGICATDVKQVRKGSSDNRYALGHEVVGRINNAPSSSTWKIGQRVVAVPYLPCGACYYCHRNQLTLCTSLFKVTLHPGGLAEKIHVPQMLAERGLVPVPNDLPNEIAALAEPLGCAVKGIEDIGIMPGDSTLVIGDGPMGLLSAAAARAYGAYPVIVAGMLSHRLTIAQEHYTDRVVDVTQEDLSTVIREYTDGRGADAVIVAVSSGEVLATAIDLVRPGGSVNAFAGVSKGISINLDVHDLHYKQYVLTGSFGVTPPYIRKALHLLHSGQVNGRPLITACFPFEATSEAIAYSMNQTGLKAVVLF